MKTIARKWLVLFILAVCMCAFSAPHTVQAASCKKAAVKNVTVRKKGGKYFGYRRNGSKLKKKWAVVSKKNRKYYYYFGRNGEAYTGVHAIGTNWTNTKLYVFSSKGRLDLKKTKALEKLSASKSDVSKLLSRIGKYDRKNTFKKKTACGVTFYVYRNAFTVYILEEKGKELVDYVEAN